jgi:hypothetical protein
MRSFQVMITVGWLAVAFASSAGCGGGGLAPLEGKVTLDGKPLAGATVSFLPTRGGGPGPFVAETDDSGAFALGTVERPRQGAEPGEYFVYIITVKSDPTLMENAPPPTKKEIVPMAFRDGSKRYTVPEGGTKSADFTMSSR